MYGDSKTLIYAVFADNVDKVASDVKEVASVREDAVMDDVCKSFIYAVFAYNVDIEASDVKEVAIVREDAVILLICIVDMEALPI